MTVTELKEHYRNEAIFWTKQINEINNLSKEQLLQLDPDNDPFYTRMSYVDSAIDLAYLSLINYIGMLNDGII
ncbi:hypothetical protein [Fusobacterium ulcerans]|uniref:hypothetical protein n=1 Tax=Fusobacterium ulcerans TaxID=861 RepID=UPI003FEE4055